MRLAGLARRAGQAERERGRRAGCGEVGRGERKEERGWDEGRSGRVRPISWFGLVLFLLLFFLFSFSKPLKLIEFKFKFEFKPYHSTI